MASTYIKDETGNDQSLSVSLEASVLAEEALAYRRLLTSHM